MTTLNGWKEKIMTRYEFNKRFADGEQYLIQDNNGDAKEMQRDFYWQERAVYNRIKPILKCFWLNIHK